MGEFWLRCSEIVGVFPVGGSIAMKTKPEVSATGRIVGTRITVWDVYQYIERGRNLEYIAGLLPLSLGELEAAVEFIEANRDYVVRVHREIEERIRRGNPPEIERKVEQTKRRMEQWLRERLASERSAGGSDNAAEGAAG